MEQNTRGRDMTDADDSGEVGNQGDQETPVTCPRCGSTQILPHKKGFSSGTAAVGCLLAGPVGLAGGMIGSNRIKLACLKCGEVFDPGGTLAAEPPAALPPPTQEDKSILPTLGIVFGVIALLILISWYANREEQPAPARVIRIGDGNAPPGDQRPGTTSF